MALENVFGLYFCLLFLLIKLYPWNYLSRACGLYKASDLLLGDHVCEKSDAVKWIDCPYLSYTVNPIIFKSFKVSYLTAF